MTAFSSAQRARRRRMTAGFTLVEVLVAATVLGIAVVGLMGLSSRSINIVRSAIESAAVAQSLQERMEQLRTAGWTQLTSNYPPGTDDGQAGDDDPDDDPELADDPDVVYTDTNWENDLSDLSISDPGLATLMTTPITSSTELAGVSEVITVVPYPPKGATAIQVTRQNGVVSIQSHNAYTCQENMIRLTVKLSWTPRRKDASTQARQTCAVFARTTK